MLLSQAAAMWAMAQAASVAADAATGGAGAAAAPAPLKFGLVTEACFDTLVVRHQLDLACLKAIAAKLIGYAIMTGALIVKTPLILSIVRSGKADGLSGLSIFLETVMYGWAASYNVLNGNPISSWGESLIIMVQNVIVLALLARLGDKPTSPLKTIGATLLFLAGMALPWALAIQEYAALVSGAGAQAAPSPVAFLSAFLARGTKDSPDLVRFLELLYHANTALFVMSRLPQIAEFFRLGHTGSASGITFLMQFGGSSARVFTTTQEVNDPNGVIFYSFALSATLNGILFFQYLFYFSATRRWEKANAGAAKGAKEEAKKEEAKKEETKKDK